MKESKIVNHLASYSNKNLNILHVLVDFMIQYIGIFLYFFSVILQWLLGILTFNTGWPHQIQF